MDLPSHLRQAIETTHVAFEGLSHPLRVIGTEADPPPPREPEALRITVEAVHNGEPRHATCAFSVPTLDDERHVATTLAETMRNALSEGN